MFKRSLLLLIGLLLAATVAGAAPVQPPYPIAFWVIGSLEAPAGAGLTTNDLAGFKVFMFNNPSDYTLNYASAESVNGGPFAINGMADYAMTLEAGKVFWFGTEPKDIGGISYGMSMKSYTITDADMARGYINFGPGFFTLTAGGGLGVVGTTEGDGISIQRAGETAGSGLIISWDKTKFGNTNPKIYAMAGDGTGQFTNTYNSAVWYLVYDGANLQTGWPATLGTFTVGPGDAITHNGQVGQGSNEVYYKALAVGFDPSTDPASFRAAPAVGKINLFLRSGKNLINVPLSSSAEMTVQAVFGQGSGAVWQDGDIVQSKFAPSPAYYSAVYQAGSWKDAASPSQPPDFRVNYNFGNWVILTADKTISLVGNVVNTDTNVDIFTGAGESSGGKTLLGLTYPVKFGLAASSLLTDGAAAGDLMQYKVSAADEAYISAVVIGGSWKNAANPSDPIDARIGTLVIPNSYIFVRYGTSGFTWKRVRPN